MNYSIFAELKRRNVFKVASVYLITSWLVLQIIAVLAPYLKLPSMFGSIVTVVLIIGFPFACIFAWAFELTPDGVKLSKDVEHHDSITHQTGNKINTALVVSLLLTLAYISYDKFFTYEVDDSQTLSIAVLPFADMSPDKSQEYFSDGIAEEILNSLARLKKLQVIARTSSFQFKNKEQDIRTIAETLGASYVLEGSVRKDRNKLRVTAQLIEAQTGMHIWSETYDRQLNDIFSLQDELTFAITQALKLNLLPEEVKAEQGMTSNQGAYDLFLKGRDLGYQRNAQALNQAKEYLQQAIELDPDFDLAKAQLYVVYILAMEYGDTNYNEGEQAAKQLYLELLGSEYEFPLKYAVIASQIQRTENAPKLVSKIYQRAALKAPSDPIIQNWYLSTISTNGNIEKAIEAREAFFKVNPLDQINIHNLLLAHYWLGNLTEYKFYADKLQKDSPDHSVTAEVIANKLYIAEKTPKAALKYLESFKGKMNTDTKRIYVDLLLVTGQIDKAVSTLANYLGENAQNSDKFFTSITNLLAFLDRTTQLKFSLLDIQNKLNLNDQDFNYYTLAAQAMNGNAAPYIQYMDEQFQTPDKFRDAKKEIPLMLTYAMHKFNKGDERYLQRYSFLSTMVEPCRKTNGRLHELCALALVSNGETDENILLTQAQNSLEVTNPAFMGVGRYVLTSPHLGMLQDQAEFKTMAEEYLNRTYRKWEKEFVVE